MGVGLRTTTWPVRDVAMSAGFVVMWSSGYIGGRWGTATAGTTTLMAWRFALVAVALAVLAGWLRRFRGPRRRLPPREVAAQLAVGVLAQALYVWGNVGAIELGVGAGTAALIAALQPIVTGILAGPVLGETVDHRQRAGLALGLLGVGLVVGADLSTGHSAPWWAYALPFLGMAALVAATLLERRTRAADTPLVDALALQATASAVLFAVVAGVTGRWAPPTDHLGTFAMAVAWFIGLSTVGAYGFYWLTVRRHGATRVSGLIYLTPPATMLWAWLAFGDPVGPHALVGLAVCLLAVLLVYSPRLGR